MLSPTPNILYDSSCNSVSQLWLLAHIHSRYLISVSELWSYNRTHFTGILVVVNKNSRFHWAQILTEKCLQLCGKVMYNIRKVALGSRTQNFTTWLYLILHKVKQFCEVTSSLGYDFQYCTCINLSVDTDIRFIFIRIVKFRIPIYYFTWKI